MVNLFFFGWAVPSKLQNHWKNYGFEHTMHFCLLPCVWPWRFRAHETVWKHICFRHRDPSMSTVGSNINCQNTCRKQRFCDCNGLSFLTTIHTEAKKSIVKRWVFASSHGSSRIVLSWFVRAGAATMIAWKAVKTHTISLLRESFSTSWCPGPALNPRNV